MCVMIHYDLQAQPQSPKAIRDLLEKLRRKALELPFRAVGELIEFVGEAADYENYEKTDPLYWFLLQAVETIRPDGHAFDVKPEHVIAFTTIPGDGCQDAYFGLASHLEIVGRSPKTFHTGLQSWSWSGYCSTVGASKPECGDIENFLRCHLAIVNLLDYASELCIVKEVLDDGDFFHDRNEHELVMLVMEWNCLVTGKPDEVVEAEVAKLITFLNSLDFEE